MSVNTYTQENVLNSQMPKEMQNVTAVLQSKQSPQSKFQYTRTDSPHTWYLPHPPENRNAHFHLQKSQRFSYFKFQQ